LFEWLKKENADFVCLQEVRAQLDDIKSEVFWPDNYYCYHYVAIKKGYSGVAIFTKSKPNNIIEGLGCKEFDDEGRYIECEFDDFSLASVYFPSGSSGDQRQEVKYRFLDSFKNKLKAHNFKNKGYLFCGDINIVHKEIDIANWRANQKNSGCLPKERAWLDMVFNELNCVDVFRKINQEKQQYTWWSNRGNAWANNVGWRIDYQICNNSFKKQALKASIYKDERFSDHAPLIMTYD
tara:strand:+ start:5289 stop:5999 length:711 start_codon:yes stop_codon:yes gene_type:complete